CKHRRVRCESTGRRERVVHRERWRRSGRVRIRLRSKERKIAKRTADVGRRDQVEVDTKRTSNDGVRNNFIRETQTRSNVVLVLAEIAKGACRQIDRRGQRDWH